MPDPKPVIIQSQRGASAFNPLVDKVGVPLLWFALGFLAAVIFKKRTP